MNVHYSVQPLYPQFSGLLNVTKYLTGFQVVANITKPGNLFCGAFLSGYPIASTSDILQQGHGSPSLSGGLVMVTILLLQPDTNYDIYCYTDDFYTHVMGIDVALQHKVTKQTSCCKKIVFSSAYQFVPQYYAGKTLSEPVFSISINAIPLADLSISLYINNTLCPGANPKISLNPIFSASVTPQRIVFLANSSYLPTSFVIRGTTLGCYILTAMAPRGSRFVSAVNTFNIVSFRLPPTTPTFIGAAYSNDGTYVALNFDLPTDRGQTKITNSFATFSCSRILSSPPSAVRSTCSWLSYTQLAVKASSIPFPQVGDTVTILGQVIKAQCTSAFNCSSSPYLARFSNVIALPSNPVKPVPFLSAPNQVDHCDSIVLDATASVGFCGQPWKNVSLTITAKYSGGSSQNNSLNLIAIQKYLTSFKDTKEIFFVPNYYLNEFATYTFSLMVTNILGQSAVAAATVHVNDPSQLTPQVRIVTSSTFIYRWQSLSLFATAAMPSCRSNASNVLFTYSWSIYKNITLLSLQSTSQDPRFFTLPTYSLDSGSYYKVQVTANVNSITNTNLITSTDVTSIQIGQSQPRLVAVISGASSRTLSIDNSFTVDASGSYDIDYPEYTSNLQYLWTCVTQSPVYGSPCSEFNISSSAILLVPSNSLSAGVYAFNVKVFNTDGDSASQSCTITLSSSSSPVISLTSSASVYNVDQKVLITANLILKSYGGSANWSSPDIDLSKNIALTPLSSRLTVGSSSIQLAICSKCLTGGLSYTFRISASYAFSGSKLGVAVAALTIRINSPPYGGTMTVVPSQGRALVDIFVFETVSWIDDPQSYPLSYVFSSYVLNPSDAVALNQKGIVTQASSYLGPGLSALGYSTFCVTTVYDVMGANANVTTRAVVFPPVSLASVISATNSLLSLAFANNNAASVNQILTAAVTSVNRVDCTVPVPCGQINRQLCSTTAYTCGSCISGYVGAEGDSNSKCYPAATISSVGGACSKNSSCVSGICQSKKCTDSLKSCPRNCNGKGSCIFQDNNGNTVPYCSITNPYCQALCSCVSGSYGSDCSLSYYQLLAVAKFRETLCVNYFRSLAIEDTNLNTISSRALVASNILIDTQQTTTNALRNCTAALVQTVNKYSSLVCGDSNTLNAIIQGLSSVLARGKLLPSDLYSNVVESVRVLTSTCVFQQAVGEAAMKLVSQNLRTSLSTANGPSLLSSSFSSAQSDLQIAVSSTDQTQLKFSNPTNSAQTTVVGVSLIEITSAPSSSSSTKAKNITSSNPKIQLVVPPIRSTTGRRLAASTPAVSITVTIPNTGYLQTRNLYPRNVSVRCPESKAQPYFVYGNCSSKINSNFTLKCNAYSKGTYVVSCPGYVATPRCLMTDDLGVSNSANCRVVAHNPYNTTCFCTNLYYGSKESFSVQYDLVKYNYHYKYNADSNKQIINYSIVVIGFLSAVVVIFLCGLSYLYMWRKRVKVKRNKNVQSIESLFSLQEVKEDYSEYFLRNLTRQRLIHTFFEDIFPATFRNGRWFEVIGRGILNDHIFINIWFDSQLDSMTSKTDKWTIFCTRILMYLFSSTLIARLLFADDGYCFQFKESVSCAHARVDNSWFDSCQWDSSSSGCLYRPPSTTFYTLFPLVAATIILSTLLEMVVKQLVSSIVDFSVVKYNEAKSKKLPLESDITASIFTNDEFRTHQSWKANLLRGSRLEKAKRSMDSLLPLEEASILSVQLEKTRASILSQNVFYMVLDSETYARKRYGFNGVKSVPIERVLAKVETARAEARYLKKEMELTRTNEERELLLMKHFLVDIFSGYRQEIASQYFFRGYVSPQARNARFDVCLINIVSLTVYVLVIVILTYVFGSQIGSNAIPMWGEVVGISIIGDLFILQIVKVVWHNLLVVSIIVGEEARELCERFSNGSKTILRRLNGLMRDANCLLQHFNPACRVARSLPHLPVSRLLLSIGDQDLPSPKHLLMSKRGALSKLCRKAMDIFMSIYLLPPAIADGIEEVLIAAIIAGLVLCFYIISTIFIWLPLLIVFAIALVFWTNKILVKRVTESLARRALKRSGHVEFYEVDERGFIKEEVKSDIRFRPLQSIKQSEEVKNNELQRSTIADIFEGKDSLDEQFIRDSLRAVSIKPSPRLKTPEDRSAVAPIDQLTLDLGMDDEIHVDSEMDIQVPFFVSKKNTASVDRGDGDEFSIGDLSSLDMDDFSVVSGVDNDNRIWTGSMWPPPLSVGSSSNRVQKPLPIEQPDQLAGSYYSPSFKKPPTLMRIDAPPISASSHRIFGPPLPSSNNTSQNRFGRDNESVSSFASRGSLAQARDERIDSILRSMRQDVMSVGATLPPNDEEGEKKLVFVRYEGDTHANDVSWQSLLFEEDNDNKSVISTASNAILKPVMKDRSTPTKAAAGFPSRGKLYSANSMSEEKEEEDVARLKPNALFDAPPIKSPDLKVTMKATRSVDRFHVDQLKREKNEMSIKMNTTTVVPPSHPNQSRPQESAANVPRPNTLSLSVDAPVSQSLRYQRAKQRRIIQNNNDNIGGHGGEPLDDSTISGSVKMTSPLKPDHRRLPPVRVAQTVPGPGGIIQTTSEAEANFPAKKSFPLWDNRK